MKDGIVFTDNPEPVFVVMLGGDIGLTFSTN
jgi:hypothetical protein